MRFIRRLLSCTIVAVVGAAVLNSARAADEITVQSTSDLVAALNAATHEQIHLRPGRYVIEQPLTIPDGVTLRGEDEITYDGAGVPQNSTVKKTVLVASEELRGDLLTLGDRVAIRNLRIEDTRDASRDGNPVAIASRHPNDRIAAEIIECEIHNPNPFGFTRRGPTGYAVTVLTLNPGLGADPAPHVDAKIRLRIERSVLRADGGGAALFVNNFASRANAVVVLRRNRLIGPILAAGGTNRPDTVTGSRTRLESARNLFTMAPLTVAVASWMLIAGSTLPHFESSAAMAVSANVLHVHSIDDRIEAASAAILAVGGRHLTTGAGPVTDNIVELDLQRLEITTRSSNAADLQIYGAQRDESATVATGNVVRLRARGLHGSGVRSNVYLDDNRVSATRDVHTNRIEIAGSLRQFIRSNPGIDPLPPARFFTRED